MLGASLAAAAAAAAPLRAAGNRIDRSRLSAITDEIARSPKGAIAFAQQYGLQWLEVRSVPNGGKEYFMLPPDEVKQAAQEFRDGGVKLSFLNTSMLKYMLPGTTPTNPRTKLDGRFERRKDELRRALDFAHTFGCTKIRVFTFMRCKEQEQLWPKIAGIITELAEIAAREKVQLLIENEGACNVGSNAELVALLKHIPHKSVGINWDPHNAAHQNEVAFPDGYQMLPTKRIWNVQVKARSILPGEEMMDWNAIFRRLERDGYQGQIGLETHIFGDVQIWKSHESIREMLRLAGSPVAS
ncbi:MAG: sugar phosphate isomerase/epimerase [Bryobacterales bacterium]|nr:sugar phosphate isomerase/epimerase [Bryobacterales bacterium]